MFSLIISIVAIALTVALVASSMYHGGDVLTAGRTRATAAALIAGAQQISGAAQMHYALDGVWEYNPANLVTAGYLSSVPNINGHWLSLSGSGVAAQGVSADVCSALAAVGSSAYHCANGIFAYNMALSDVLLP